MTREEQRQKLVGMKFGRLTVIRYTQSEPRQGPCYLCRCECGNEKEIRGSSLTHGATESCGCIQREHAKSGWAHYQGNGKPHGKTGTQIYRCWEDLMSRCYNKNSVAYKYYGAKEIQTPNHWKHFDGFYKDMGDPPTEKHTIDRIEGSKGYSKENCRWATRMEQAHNTKANVNITYRGQTHCRAEWARRIGISDDALKWRLKHGWSKEKSFSTKPHEQWTNQYGSGLTSEGHNE